MVLECLGVLRDGDADSLVGEVLMIVKLGFLVELNNGIFSKLNVSGHVDDGLLFFFWNREVVLKVFRGVFYGLMFGLLQRFLLLLLRFSKLLKVDSKPRPCGSALRVLHHRKLRLSCA